jgi:signal peptidase II
MKKAYYYLFATFIVIFDQISKLYFEKRLFDGSEIKVIGDYVKFNLVYNPGIAFGIRMGGKYILSAISLIASVGIIVYIYKMKNARRLELWAFASILGGAFGNLIDRFLYGKVIDFVDCDFPDIIMQRWPVFNVADSFVTIGMVLLIIQYFVFDNKKSTN